MWNPLPTHRGPHLFLSYRRDDTSGHAGRLGSDIERLFPGSRVFMDINGIHPGEDFTKIITTEMVSCNLLLVLIGRRWLTILRRHMGDPGQTDWARIEIKTAVEHKIPILPVLVNGAKLPAIKDLPEELKPLATRQAIEISDSRWNDDIRRLIAAIRQTTRGASGSGKLARLFTLIGLAVLVASLGIIAYLRIPSPGPPPGPTERASCAEAANRVVVDYSTVKTLPELDFRVAAAPYLHGFGISVVNLKPPESEVVLMNNRTIYKGGAIRPTTSQNMLTQISTGNAPASFTLQFVEPLESLEFVIPALYPASKSGITHPAWSAHALDAAGVEVSSQGEAMTRSHDDVPSHRYLLRAPGLDGIVAVRFDSDPRLNGVPFAGFSAIFIEQLAFCRQPRVSR